MAAARMRVKPLGQAPKLRGWLNGDDPVSQTPSAAASRPKPAPTGKRRGGPIYSRSCRGPLRRGSVEAQYYLKAVRGRPHD